MKTLRHLAAEINADSALGLVATVERSYSSTDRKISGTRLRHRGRGRHGLHLVVYVKRTKEKVVDLDTSWTYSRAAEGWAWLADWRAGTKQYLRCSPFGVYNVPRAKLP